MSQNCWVFIEAIHLYCLVSIPYNMDWSEFAVTKYWYWSNGFPFLCTLFWAITHSQFKECRGLEEESSTLDEILESMLSVDYFAEISLPNTSLPNISLPNMSLPNMSLPNISLPNMPLPNMSLPNISRSNISLADTSESSLNYENIDYWSTHNDSNVTCPDETNLMEAICSDLPGLEALNMSHYDEGSAVFFFPGIFVLTGNNASQNIFSTYYVHFELDDFDYTIKNYSQARQGFTMIA